MASEHDGILWNDYKMSLFDILNVIHGTMSEMPAKIDFNETHSTFTYLLFLLLLCNLN